MHASTFTAAIAWGGVEYSRLEILLPKEDASDSRVKRAHLRAKGTSKGPRSHAYLELSKYWLRTMLRFNFLPL